MASEDTPGAEVLHVVDTSGVEHYLTTANVVGLEFRAGDTPNLHAATIFTAALRDQDEPYRVAVQGEEALRARQWMRLRAGLPPGGPRDMSLTMALHPSVQHRATGPRPPRRHAAQLPDRRRDSAPGRRAGARLAKPPTSGSPPAGAPAPASPC